MPKHKIPSYRHHKQTGQSLVCFFDGMGGRRDILLGKYGTKESKAEYLRVFGEWEANGRRIPSKGKSADTTMNELMVVYLKHAKTYYTRNGKPTAELDCVKSGMRHVKELIGHTLVMDFATSAQATMLGSCSPAANRRVRRCPDYGKAERWGGHAGGRQHLDAVGAHTYMLVIGPLER